MNKFGITLWVKPEALLTNQTCSQSARKIRGSLTEFFRVLRHLKNIHINHLKTCSLYSQTIIIRIENYLFSSYYSPDSFSSVLSTPARP